nr:hypothetical protein B0A51_08497 [Rachicladosporium sp. CCFEE 5018]OQO28375.1 hypothetical protein B0A51_04867 [Rachicladosporium sp. CCFEE 5018]OQO28560.1 hypothetical protein B0A51_05606 [Rachicladosporium sp. CCFEE 5018]
MFQTVRQRDSQMGADEEGRALATPEYWNSRYEKSASDQPTHEWFRSFEALEPFLRPNLYNAFPPQTNPHILHLGSGDSTVPADLAKRGYNNQLCVDFSKTVVNLMSKRHESTPGISWRWADVRDLEDVPTESVDVAFDKGTLDAFIHGSPWDPPEEVKDSTGRYMQAVHRVLKADGVFLYITFRQPHFIKPLLNAAGLWEMQMETLGGKSSFDYFAFVLKKA